MDLFKLLEESEIENQPGKAIQTNHIIEKNVQKDVDKNTANMIMNDFSIIQNRHFILNQHLSFLNDVFLKEDSLSLLEIKDYLNTIDKSDYSDFIFFVTAGNPRLINSLIKYLAHNRWTPNSLNILVEIFARDYALNIYEFTYNVFCANVSHNARKLIYRLDILLELIERDTIKEVASIKPVIHNVDQAISELEIHWLKIKDGCYYINTFLKGIGSKFYDESQKNVIYKNRLNEIKSNRKGTISDRTSNAIQIYSLLLKDYASFCQECFNVTKALLSKDNDLIRSAFSNFEFFRFWLSTDININISNSDKLLIRIYQFIIQYKINQIIDYVRMDLIRLLEKYQEVDIEAIKTMIYIFSQMQISDVQIELSFIRVIYENSAILKKLERNLLRVPDNIKNDICDENGHCSYFYAYVNSLFYNTKKYEIQEFEFLFDYLLQSPLLLINKFLNTPIINRNIFDIFDYIYLLLYNTAVPDKDINRYLMLLEKSLELSRLSGNPYIMIATVKTQMLIYGEEIHDFESVKSIFNKYKEISSLNEGICIYYLYSTYATQLYLVNKNQTDFEAISLYKDALSSLKLEYYYYVLDAYFVIKRAVHIIIRNSMTIYYEYFTDQVTNLLKSEYIMGEFKVDCFSILGCILQSQGKLNDLVVTLFTSFDYSLKSLEENITTEIRVLETRTVLTTLFLKYIWNTEILKVDSESVPTENRGLELSISNLWQSFPLLHKAYQPQYILTSIVLFYYVSIELKMNDWINHWIFRFHDYTVKNSNEIENCENYHILFESYKLQLEVLKNLNLTEKQKRFLVEKVETLKSDMINGSQIMLTEFWEKH